MDTLIAKILPSILPGLIYGIGALGLAVTLRFLRFPDFTVLGSIMAGGVLCIVVTNKVGPVLGVLAGCLAGCSLGCVTSLLVCALRIEPVLAGIITFTASLTPGFLLTDGGRIDLEKGKWAILQPTFSFADVGYILVLLIVIFAISSVVVRTKFGSLTMAMTADPRFVRHRHRYRSLIITSLLVLGNMLVGLAGALFALRQTGANVISHSDFLPFSLGSIFGGNALAVWISHRLNVTRIDTTHETDEKGFAHPSTLLKGFTHILSADKDDTKKIGFLFCLYVVGCLVFSIVTGMVDADAFKFIHSISPNWQHLATAMLIALCVWWAGVERE